MDTAGTIIKFFQDGGTFMYPIAIVAALGVAVAIERYLYLTRTAVGNKRVWSEVAPFLSQGDYRKALAATTDSASAIGQILSYGLARVQSARRRDDVEKAMEESMMEVVPRLEKRTHYLSSFANIATLLAVSRPTQVPRLGRADPCFRYSRPGPPHASHTRQRRIHALFLGK